MTPQPDLVHDLIWDHARRSPDEVAVIDDGTACTYRELTTAADAVARQLAALGAGPDRVVGLAFPRTVDGLVHLLGILRAGAAALYLDPAWPRLRIEHMAATCGVSLIADATAGIYQRLASNGPDHSGHRWAAGTAEQSRSVPRVGADRLCYVVFTSGSTGTPSGVLVEHRGVRNTVTALADAFEIAAGTRVLQFAAWSWDAAMCEILTTLTAGGTLVVCPESARSGGTVLADVLRRHAVEVVTLTPSVLDAVPAADLPALRTVVSVGEPCHPGLVRRWTAPHRRVLNGYGPTEASIAVSVGVMTPGTPIHIGTPLRNVTVRVVDDGRDVQLGAVGELWVGGPGLARGYAADPARTAARFITDADGRRWYRTGDLVSRRPDGTLVYAGRVDDQVKIRGHRVELGEIEQMLCTHPAVRSCAVVVAGGRLVAYVVGADPHAEPATVREAAASQAMFWLPDFMTPDAIHVVVDLPLTGNGKVDRAALTEWVPRAAAPASAPAASVAVPSAPNSPASSNGKPRVARPTGGVLDGVLEVASRVLKVPVGADDNVFDLGGHSLLAAELSVALSDVFGVDLAFDDVMRHPTGAALADRVAALTAHHLGGAPSTPR